MKLKLIEIKRNTYLHKDGDFLHSLELWITRDCFGFVFKTPNFCSGTWINPINAIRHYMDHCCKADEKSTYHNL